MAEYIEREKALDFISEVEPIICMPPDNKPTFTAVKDPDMVAYLESIPAADVRPVVRGQWVNGKCNQCGERAPFWSMATTYYRSRYCPNCGAEMEES